MTLLFHDKLFEDHDTGQHAETSARLATIRQRLEVRSPDDKIQMGTIRDVPASTLTSIHDAGVAIRAEQVCRNGGGWLDADTVVCPKSFEVALTAAGTAVAAVDEVVRGHDRNALCLIRPPGHHATRRESMGFCVFNNVAMAAQWAMQQHGLQKILIVDWDVHHGNGTQDIFYDDDRVMFFSIHRFPFYPGTGTADETGTGKGLGTTINAPIAMGTSRSQYLGAFERGLERAAERIKPELIILSAGFDAHKSDPVGSLGLETEDYPTMTRLVMDVADHFCAGRIVSCLEGGYHLGALADSLEVHLDTLAGITFRSMPSAT